jgi:pSer/pThr/pTyr-binding forkhead associated (FHA) protein
LSHQEKFSDKNPAGPQGKPHSSAVLDVQKGGKFEIQYVTTIGRAPDCHIIINERSVSRHHARIFYESGHYWIKDLDSANGTKLNGKKISFQMLSDNDKIVFGEAKAVFHTSEHVPGPVPVGSDPLEGSDSPFQDGTPTGGFSATAAADDVDEESRQSGHRWDTIQDRPPVMKDREQIRTSHSLASAETLEQENERLRQLVKQLERALADSNLRIRNLQELLDRKMN